MCHRLDGYMCGGPPLVNGTCPHHKGLVPADLSASHAFVIFKVWDTCVRSSLFREGPLFPLPLLEARSGTLVPAPLIQRDRVCGSSLLRAALPCLELCLRAPLPYSARLPVGAPPVLVTPLPSPTSVGYFPTRPVLLKRGSLKPSFWRPSFHSGLSGGGAGLARSTFLYRHDHVNFDLH